MIYIFVTIIVFFLSKIIYKKLGDYLTRKGYDYSIVKDVLRKILNKCDDFNRKDERIHLSENDIDKLYNIAQKRYQIAIKSEEDRNKIYRKIGTYLLRRGYLWEDIKKVLGKIMEDFSI